MDYTKYPEGFDALVNELDNMPSDDPKAKGAFMISFLDALIKQ